MSWVEIYAFIVVIALIVAAAFEFISRKSSQHGELQPLRLPAPQDRERQGRRR